MIRRGGLRQVVLVGFVVVYLGWQVTRFGGVLGDQVAVGYLWFVAALGLAIVGSESAARRCAATPGLARSWHLVSVGLGLYLAANAVAAYLEVAQHRLPYPSLADALFLSFYLFFFSGLVGFARHRHTGTQRAKLALDVLIVGIAASMLLWYLEIGSSVSSTGQGALSTAIAIAYPVGDLLLVTGGAAALLGGVPRATRPAVIALMFGVLLYVVTDLAYAQIVLHGEYHGGDRVDIGWMLATVAFALGAALQPPTTAEADGAVHREPARRAGLLPYLGTAVGLSVLLVSERHQSFFPDISLTLAAVTLAVAVTVRQAVAQRALHEQEDHNTDLVDQLRHQAFHDPLTGLPNRALFTERLEQALRRAHRSNRPVGVLMLDLDQFKAINDTLGHGAGDRLLTAVGEQLRRAAREEDTVARLGGDEFALVLEDLDDPTIAVTVAGRILTMLQHPASLGDRQVTTTASIGVAVATDLPVTAEELLRDADTAMYAAKQGGRNRFRVFEPAMHDHLSEQAQLGSDLRDAWNRGEISVSYQPILDLNTGLTTGLEALARWRHPTRGQIPPGVFIPIAEELGLVHDLDMWVLDEACGRAGRWHHDHPDALPLGLHVNLSPRQLLEPDLARRVARTLKQSALPPRQLTLELVESTLVSDDQLVAQRLAELKALGIRIAIDDFGTGYSNLAYLQRLPIDVLKIDRTFVQGMTESGPGSALLHALVQLGQVLGLEVVAEGIETPQQLQQLQDEDCPKGQGFLFNRPIPGPQVDAFLSSHGVGLSSIAR